MMDYFNQIHRGSASSALHGKAEIDDVPIVSRTAIRQSKKRVPSEKNNLPHLSIADIKPQDVRGFLRLQPDLNFKSCWQSTTQGNIQGPEYLGSILSGYSRAAGKDSESKPHMRSRLEAIFFAVLASKKRESASAYGSLHIQFEKSLSLPWTHNHKAYLLEGTTDYTLWYGDQKKETNLLLFLAPQRGKIGRYQALSCMAMLHHARKRARCNDTTVYGIVTDSYEWRFLCIDNQSRYSGCLMSLDKGQQVEIISSIYKILNHAAALAQALEAPSLTEYRSVEDASGLEWSDRRNPSLESNGFKGKSLPDMQV